MIRDYSWLSVSEILTRSMTALKFNKPFPLQFWLSASGRTAAYKNWLGVGRNWWQFSIGIHGGFGIGISGGFHRNTHAKSQSPIYRRKAQNMA